MSCVIVDSGVDVSPLIHFLSFSTYCRKNKMSSPESSPVQGTKPDFRERTSSFYFETRPSRRSIDLDFDGAYQYGYEYVDKIPAGSVVEEFYSRPIDVTKVKHTYLVFRISADFIRPSQCRSVRSRQNNRDKVEVENVLTSTDEDISKITTKKNIGTMLLIRKVPVKVEPKVFFANERLMLFWMH